MKFSKGAVQQKVFEQIESAKYRLQSPCELERREAAAQLSVLRELSETIKNMENKSKRE